MEKLVELELASLRETHALCVCHQNGRVQNGRVLFDVSADYLPQLPNRGSRVGSSMTFYHCRLCPVNSSKKLCVRVVRDDCIALARSKQRWRIAIDISIICLD